jgi:hypothetical protein
VIFIIRKFHIYIAGQLEDNSEVHRVMEEWSNKCMEKLAERKIKEEDNKAMEKLAKKKLKEEDSKTKSP